MKIGIIGSRNIGGTTARLFVNAGHRIAISNSTGPQSLDSLVASIGVSAKAMTVNDAVAYGDVVLVAIPWRNKEALRSIPSSLLKNKIVIDASNPFSENFELIDMGSSTSNEEVAKELPGARLVKAFNTLYYETLGSGGLPLKKEQDRLVLFVASNDAGAKDIVSKLIEDIGFKAVDTGSLIKGGRKQQPNSPIYNNPMTTEEA